MFVFNIEDVSDISVLVDASYVKQTHARQYMSGVAVVFGGTSGNASSMSHNRRSRIRGYQQWELKA